MTQPSTPPPPPDAIEEIRLTSTRRTIARRLAEAWEAPVFQLGVSVDMSEVLSLRDRLADGSDSDLKPTVSDLLTHLVGSALSRHPAVNATFDGNTIQRHSTANVGIAVAAPNGLVVPVIRNVNHSTVQEIVRQRADIVARARTRQLTAEDMQGGTFTISNLGMYGIEQFIAVLNPPQVAILAVGAVREIPVALGGEVAVRSTMHMTLTCDHRAVDGAESAMFLQTLVALVAQAS